MKKSLEEQLEEAIKLASIKHYGQRDKSNKPYIFHLLYVMNNLDDLKAKIVGVLHDILEDTDITRNDLLNCGFSEEIIHSVEVLTKSKNQEYMEYIEKIKGDNVARKIKLIDLKHNTDLTRLSEISDNDLKRTMKYFQAYKSLSEW
ncbi:HD domain-containing protein [Clostridium perfringens]|uniref:HD domain-containing protein n=1 Tax=Clostridium perfringens TaxID=1502 RepID=A0A8H9QY88_CLOPF|nr:HD domain-containing protein [Clostridium perfringens]ELC8460400.1 HD domain-containing protein [Clostridium perfringens]HAT4307851.1 HD domain-containing protein [Clostridium perfringens]